MQNSRRAWLSPLPRELKFHFLAILPPLMLDIDHSIRRHNDLLSCDLDAKRLSALDAVCQPAQLLHELPGRILLFYIAFPLRSHQHAPFTPNPDKPEPNMPQRHEGTKNSKSLGRPRSVSYYFRCGTEKEAQNAQRVPFLIASFALFCGKYSIHFEKILIP